MSETTPTTLITVSHFRTTPILGKTHSQQFMEKLIRVYNVQPKGTSVRGAKQYDVKELEDCLVQYAMDNGSDVDDTEGGSVALKNQKLQEQIKKLQKESRNADLRYEQLQNELVDAKEELEYLNGFKAIISSVVRRLFTTQMPMEVVGLDIPKARNKGEQYYNEFVSACHEATKIWKHQQTVPETDLEKLLYKVVHNPQPISGSVEIKGETV